jgi:hypothetical protein
MLQAVQQAGQYHFGGDITPPNCCLIATTPLNNQPEVSKEPLLAAGSNTTATHTRGETAEIYKACAASSNHSHIRYPELSQAAAPGALSSCKVCQSRLLFNFNH